MTDYFLEPSDAELLQRYRDGDDAAAGELYARHHPAAVRLATSLWGPSRAEDLASDAFVAVMRAVRNGAGPQFAFRPYLLTSVRNAFYAASRSDSRHVWLDDVEESNAATSVDDGTAAREESSLLAQAFATLPERWQAVLWHTTIHDETPEQVAGTLGMKPSAVTSLAHRAREGLRQAYLAAHLAGTDSEECRQVRELLPAHDRGRLGKRQTARVDAHLDDCDECREAAAMLGGISANLGWVLLPALLGAPGVLAFGSPATQAALATGAAGLGAGGAGSGGAGGPGGGAGGAAASGGVLTSAVGLTVAASVAVAAAAVGAVVVNELRGDGTVESASAPVSPPAPEPDPAPGPEPETDPEEDDEEERPAEESEERRDPQDRTDEPVPSSAPTPRTAPPAPEPSRTREPSPGPPPVRPFPSPAPSPSPTPTPEPTPEPEPGVDLVLTVTAEGDAVRFAVNAGGLTPILRIEFPTADRWTIRAGLGWQCQRAEGATSGTCTATQSDPPDLVLSAPSAVAGTPPASRPISATVSAQDNIDPDESNNTRTLAD